MEAIGMRRIVLLALGSTLAACATEMATAPTAVPPNVAPNFTAGANPSALGGRFGGPWLGLSRLPDNLKLTDAQRAQVTAAVQDFQSVTKSDRDAMRAIMQQASAARQAGASRDQARQLFAQGKSHRDHVR